MIGAVPLNLTATLVSTMGDCPAVGAPTGSVTVLYTGNAQGAQTLGTRALAPGANQVWCFHVSVGANSPQSQASTVSFSFRADQT
ncbi:hypothetical protein [Rhodococcus sovatensis]|uniref:Uncharacterized protein n=1 Tax=Rhodococcus sovatensis TaxID=1805840 RepID=A0ABZ2PH55_9NOCA